jgi:hypothetical protein
MNSCMHLPRSTRLFPTSLALALSLSAACTNMSVTRTSSAHEARPADCAVRWEQGSYQRLAADYEWVGEVTLHNERGLTLADAKREAMEAQACELGGDTLLRAVDATNLSGFGHQKFGVLRRRTSDEAAGGQSPAIEDAPKPEESERVAAGGRRGRALLR